ncbi:hypothetical protein [Christensenella tenuis]|jgi:hypothetical protein|uniref:Uncharacterized protein n=1 Tax=Christensenella tenuis TaxID=2763033 RepID=A0ABR7EEN7_9FIRM|nr:hypothetical protein [Christensenella tenuis]MBC5648250.1 hypothetical protein [Christensenella tenuis]
MAKKVRINVKTTGGYDILHPETEAGQVAMTGYAKPVSGGAVSASDTVSAAIGKLERGLDSAGHGDMNKVTYDTEDRGYVDRAVLADNAEKLGGESPEYYRDAETLGGHSASYFAQDKYARWEGSNAANPASGITTDDSNIIWRDGDTIHINLVLRGTLNNGWALATLPAACPKPNITRNFAAICRKSSNAAAYYAEAVINTAGTISLRAESGDAGVYSAAMIYASYPVR